MGKPVFPAALGSALQYLLMDLDAIQQALREQGFDGWLFYDHHHRDEIAYSILGLPELHVTRRWFYLIPAVGRAGEVESSRGAAASGYASRGAAALRRVARAP